MCGSTILRTARPLRSQWCASITKEITITRLRDMMGTDMKGTNLVGLQKAANELGFSTAAVRVDRENF